jgi:hypothetical protein
MDKILITYRGGYGDIHSVLASYPIKKNQEITFLVESNHIFLKAIYPWVKFLRNPISQLYEKEIKRDKILEHIEIKEGPNFNQRKYDESIIETSFHMWSEQEEYYNFYKKLISQHDIIITNYLDLTCIKVCKELKKEWILIKSWYNWPKDSYYLNMLNESSPYRNLYYYEKDWIKGFETDPNGDYKYMDTSFYKYNTNEIKEKFNLSFKAKGKEKIFFATLGSMSKDNINIGRNIKQLYLKKIKELFDDGWYGITVDREYKSFLKNNTPEKWLFVCPEWYPHDIIFDYISLFLTHGGAGSFGRAISRNKKMIVFPFQLDQFYFGEIAKNHYEGEMII